MIKKGWWLIKFSDYDMISPTVLKVTLRLLKPNILMNSQRPEPFLDFPAIRVLKYNYYIQLTRTVKQKHLLLVTFQGIVKIALRPSVMRVDSSITIHNKVSLVLCPENNLLYPYG